MTKTQEQIAREAAERNIARKARMIARAELYKHLHEVLEPVEKVRGVCDILAEQHGVNKAELWKWAVSQFSE